MSAVAIVDAAGAQMGGAARYLDELRQYLRRTGREDVTVIGSGRRLGPRWVARRELAGRASGPGGRRIALNNVGFLMPGSPRWTLLRNALHFLADGEEPELGPPLRAAIRRNAAVVRYAARRSDVLITPSAGMAERVARALPALRDRLVVRPHPVSPGAAPRLPPEPAILCPVLFAPYKQMPAHLAGLLAALDAYGDPALRLRVTAAERELPDAVARHPRVELLGRLGYAELRRWQARSRAFYFPSGLESFGYPLAEGRVSGQPVIAADTGHNREIAGPALCGFTPGDARSLLGALECALTATIAPDPVPFDPGAYFGWLLGPQP